MKCDLYNVIFAFKFSSDLSFNFDIILRLLIINAK